MLGQIEGSSIRGGEGLGWGVGGQQKMRWLDNITNPMAMNLSKLQEIEKERGAWCAAVHGTTKSRT